MLSYDNKMFYFKILVVVFNLEFFMDGLGYLLVATCGDVSIDHQHVARSAHYRKFRKPTKDDSEFKLQLHFFKNHLKCIKYG